MYLKFLYGFTVINGTQVSRDLAWMLPSTPKGLAIDISRSDADKFNYPALEGMSDYIHCNTLF